MSTAAIILAAGKGTRMKSDKPKVLHEVCGRPMLAYVVDACRAAGCQPVIGVIGHQADRVREVFAGADPPIRWAEQSPQLGTGHAVMCCGEELAELAGEVIVLAGDGPLIRPETLQQLLDTHRSEQAACTLATCVMDDPARNGRIIRDEQGKLLGIVEYLDATEAQREINEVNVSMYCFDAAALRHALGKITNDNAKGEYYLTDTLKILAAEGKPLAAVAAVPVEEAMGINTLDDLQQVEQMMRQRDADREGTDGR